jgi:hypothetical protein
LCVFLEADNCQKSRGERGSRRESKRRSRKGVQLFAAVAVHGRLPGTDLGVVLRELGEGFESLWIPNQRGSIRSAIAPAMGWRGAIPVAPNDLSINACVNVLTQAFQNRWKKSLFLIPASPWPL